MVMFSYLITVWVFPLLDWPIGRTHCRFYMGSIRWTIGRSDTVIHPSLSLLFPLGDYFEWVHWFSLSGSEMVVVPPSLHPLPPLLSLSLSFSVSTYSEKGKEISNTSKSFDVFAVKSSEEKLLGEHGNGMILERVMRCISLSRGGRG